MNGIRLSNHIKKSGALSFYYQEIKTKQNDTQVKLRTKEFSAVGKSHHFTLAAKGNAWQSWIVYESLLYLENNTLQKMSEIKLVKESYDTLTRY